MSFEKYYQNIDYLLSLDKAIKFAATYTSQLHETLNAVEIMRKLFEKKYEVMIRNLPYDIKINTLENDERDILELIYYRKVPHFKVAAKYNLPTWAITRKVEKLGKRLNMEVKCKDDKQKVQYESIDN